jgi:hypothetical protein
MSLQAVPRPDWKKRSFIAKTEDGDPRQLLIAPSSRELEGKTWADRRTE